MVMGFDIVKNLFEQQETAIEGVNISLALRSCDGELYIG